MLFLRILKNLFIFLLLFNYSTVLQPFLYCGFFFTLFQTQPTEPSTCSQDDPLHLYESQNVRLVCGGHEEPVPTQEIRGTTSLNPVGRNKQISNHDLFLKVSILSICFGRFLKNFILKCTHAFRAGELYQEEEKQTTNYLLEPEKK